jgi:thioredoxin-like negative regulator of GroEL
MDLNNMGSFYRRREIWIVYFYNPKLDECKRFEEAYSTASEKLYGIIKVAAINCLAEEELCEEFTVYDVPQILIFTENLRDDGERYNGKQDWNSLANAASKKMQNFVQSVNQENFDAFMSRDQQKSKVLYFTDKKTTSAIMKSFSKRFLDKLSIGEVRHTDELSKKFGVQKFPQLLVVTDIESYAGDVYEGEMKVDQMSKFLSTYASQQPKAVVKSKNFAKLTE